LVIDAIDSWESGGTEKQLRTLIEALDRKFFEPELLFLRPSSSLRPEDLPCPVFVASDGNSRWGMLRGLIREMRKRRPDVVQCFFRDGTYYGTLAAFLAGVPVKVSGRRNAGHWITTRDRLALPIINRLTDAWQCNSRAAFESLKSGERIPAWRIEILPNGLDLLRFSPPAESERAALRNGMGIPLGALTVVSVANLTQVKDPEIIVEAAAELHSQIPNVIFLIVGEGPLRGALDLRIKELGLTDVVRLCGAQSDVRPFLAVADIGLLTSRSEGSSNSILEYMAMELPSVISDIPSNRELADGAFFEVGSARDLSRKILDLWNNVDVRVALRRQYRLQAAEFALDALARRAQSFYIKWLASELSN
jgi:glycosyltransferase involved in cell wall biosynthesis